MTDGAAVLNGVGVALVTLFDADGAVDAEATGALAGRLVDAGVAGVVVAGTTGEADTLADHERAALIASVRRHVGASVPVIAGTGAPGRQRAAALTVAARQAGADAALVRSPPGVGDPRGFYAHVVEAAGELPVWAYHFPAVAPPGIDLDWLADLPVAGLKDSSGDPKRLLSTLARVDYPVYPGSGWLITMAGAVGCPGVILAIANAEPERCVAAFGGDGHAQAALTGPLTAGGGVGALKQLVAQRFATSTVTRLG